VYWRASQFVPEEKCQEVRIRAARLLLSARSETLANVVERPARLTQVLSNAQPGLPWLPPSFDARRPDVDLVRLRGEWVIDEVWCPRPFDFSKTYDALACGSG
jgi:hypothetical protein